MKHQKQTLHALNADSRKKPLVEGIAALFLFALWTAAVSLIDVRAIGPNGSTVGFAALNGRIHDLTGVHMTLYILTDWLGLVPVAFMLGFALLGLAQWISRKSLFKVDKSLFVLGAFYLAVTACYLLFETVVINYRPVLIDGYLEASYPSSTALLVLSAMPTAVMQLDKRIRNVAFRRTAVFLLIAFTVFMTIGRLISGVHWTTDIIGGILLAAGLVKLYETFEK